VVLSIAAVVTLIGSLQAPAAPGRAAQPMRPTEPAELLYSSAPAQADAGLARLLTTHGVERGARWALLVKKLDTGQQATYRSDQRTVAASLYKLFVLYEVFRQWDAGDLRLDEPILITARHAAEDLAIDNLQFTVGQSYPISHLLDRMIVRSDNTAAIALVERVGIAGVNRSLRDLGLTNSRLDFAGENITTAADVAALLERIALGQAISPEASRRMLDVLLAQQLNDLIPAGVPASVPVAHKTGTLPGLRHDAGIVYGPSGPYIFVALLDELIDNERAYVWTPGLSEAVYDYFNEFPAQPIRYFPFTGHFAASPFLRLWNTHQGAATIGNPLGPEQIGDGNRVQWFERARLSVPVDDPTPDRVEIERLGAEALGERTFAALPDPADPTRRWFAATGQVLDGPFLAYWQRHGGSRMFGAPLSPVFTEDLPGAGAVPVQYFERARFELHGEEVRLSNLGRLLHDSP
jgi:beta-lactamase class A